jgi:cytochrome d ubiquinol oxidase subunit II
MSHLLPVPEAARALHGWFFWSPVLAAVILAIVVLLYVLLDGFDLGVGILFATETGAENRDVMVNSIAPVWDGNETWLVLGGAGLFGIFPVAYSIILPALYPVVVMMLLSLIFRGVSFEFRFKAHTERGRAIWDLGFFGGSLVASFCQGLTLGTILQGIRFTNDSYSGGWWDWLTPFSVVCGIAVVAGYAMLGATYLIWKTEGALQRDMRAVARGLGLLVLAFIGIVSIWTPFLHAVYLNRWFTYPHVLYVSPVPILVVGLLVAYYWSLKAHHHVTPFLCTLGLFFLCFTGLGISVWPTVVPPSIDIWQASNPPHSQLFLVVGMVFLVPTILAYSSYSYWVFRGKIDPSAHYH